MKTEQVDIKQQLFQGGIKSVAGKGRLVPIHPKILPFVNELVEQDNEYLFTYQGKKLSPNQYYRVWNEVMQKIHAEKTPHEARHTFETNLDNAGGNRKCITCLWDTSQKMSETEFIIIKPLSS